LEASRHVLDLGSGQDLDDPGDCRYITGSTTLDWIDQMILIIGTRDRCTRDDRQQSLPVGNVVGGYQGRSKTAGARRRAGVIFARTAV